jgi:hypothetical protein
MLYYTSLIYATVAIHAGLYDLHLFNVLTTILLSTSLIHHSHYCETKYPGGKAIKFIDKFMAHFIGVYTTLDTIINLSSGSADLFNVIYYFCLISTIMLYYLFGDSNRKLRPYEVDTTHGLLNIISGLGLHAYIISNMIIYGLKY